MNIFFQTISLSGNGLSLSCQVLITSWAVLVVAEIPFIIFIITYLQYFLRRQPYILSNKQKHLMSNILKRNYLF